MTFEITYKADFAEAESALASLTEGIKNPKPLLYAWVAYRRGQFEQQMAAGILPDGGSPAPLSAMYEQRKRQRHGSQPIRVASGETKASYEVSVQGNSVVETVGGAAQYLQKGTSKMPARPLLPEGSLPAKDQEKLISMALAFLERWGKA